MKITILICYRGAINGLTLILVQNFQLAASKTDHRKFFNARIKHPFYQLFA